MAARKRGKKDAARKGRSDEPAEQQQDTTEDTSPESAAEGADAGFPVVGIGASAGGLSAFEAFFSGMPDDRDPDMAFVLVQHLSPDHGSILTDLIRRYVRMQVFEVEDGMVVEPNNVYIIPPNREMAFVDGKLRLSEPSAPRGQRLPVDYLFRSLADEQHERAIGVVLSGTGSDGALGVRAIKGEGGMVMVQSPTSTEYDGMPRSAIATGTVDYEMPPAEMPAQLIAYVAHAFGRPPQQPPSAQPGPEGVLRKIFALLRGQTGHDFSKYKPSTMNRRIQRRMAIHQIKAADEYVKYLGGTPAEVEALFRDLLIGVTSFFRDPEAFSTLEERVIPNLFANRDQNETIRVWSPGCSTGEEAYSLAILLQERLEALKQGFRVQVFATDIDSRAITTARNGLYPASIAADVSPERLSRFFTSEPEHNAYRITKSIRDLLVFSEQNLIRDPPFSRIDLISCRNLLIYMGGELQHRVIPLLHYALNPAGFLFLGTAETVGEYGDLFTVLDRKVRLYQRREAPHAMQRVVLGSVPAPVAPSGGALGAPAYARMPLRELTERTLLKQAAPDAALVGSNGDILYLHGRAGWYLEPPPGEAGVSNILKMAREGLKQDLTVALRQAVAENQTVHVPNLRVKTNGDFVAANVTVRPVPPDPTAGSKIPLYLITLEECRLAPAQAGHDQPPGEDDRAPDFEARIEKLKQELRTKEEYLQTTNEELETSNEELKSSNEEMQSVNEELQSTNEELETSKEELQSVNEELATVNAELQAKVADLSRANNDMNNLLAGTDIGTVFVDHQLRILRFTPTATRVINLIPSDVGRPVGHIVSNLVGYDRLVEDVQAVLDSLVPKQIELDTADGRSYSMRIVPYRTQENVIEGAVVTFFDITDSKKTREALRNTRATLGVALDNTPAGIVIADAPGDRLRYVNHAGLAICGCDRETMLAGSPDAQHGAGWLLLNLDGSPLKPDETPLARAMACGESCRAEMIVRGKDGDRFVTARAAPVKDDDGKVLAGILAFMDITDRKQAEEALQKALNEAKILRGILPICARCKKIRDDEGYWEQVDVYIREHSEAEFSHGLCPDCAEEFCRDFFEGGAGADSPTPPS